MQDIMFPRRGGIAIANLDSTTNGYEQRAGTWTLYHHLKNSAISEDRIG
ncbi:MAG UNVERIFIED_CONTAM: hypothetical protein LVR29_25735 [Microcystis novacekii LVE1205-3]